MSDKPHFEVKDGHVTIESINRVRQYWIECGFVDSVKWLDQTMEQFGFKLDMVVVFDDDN